jgi:alpha-beta hydrolase superfamily lysophospholipase
MLTVEKWLEERLTSVEPSAPAAERVARLVGSMKTQVSVSWFAVPLASGVGTGVLLFPQNAHAHRRSLVIHLHALGRATIVSEWRWAQALVAKGIPVLAVEWDGHGEKGSLWDVSTATRSLPLILHKLYATLGEAPLSHVQQFPKCFLMGNSFGATLALLAAARPDTAPLISGVVAISPMITLAGMDPENKTRKRFRGGIRALRKNSFHMGMGIDPFDQVRAFLLENIEKRSLLQNVQAPVLWMHGARDRLVPVDSAVQKMTKIPAALFTHIDEKCGHKLSPVSHEVANYASRFVERCVDTEHARINDI